MSASRPFVSVLTPTYNRRLFLPAIVECYLAQTYPKDRMEWLIYDDGEDSVQDFFESHIKPKVPNARYIRSETKLKIGAKRNRLNAEAKGDILVAMDDDDYYPPERVQHAVIALNRDRKIQLAGCSTLYMYYFDTGEIYKFGPLHARHATNGTFAIRKEYAKTHLYDETVTHAEEKSFLEDYKHPMVQLDPLKVMLVMAHSSNTYDKRPMRDQKKNPLMKATTTKLKDVIRNEAHRNFYINLKTADFARPVVQAPVPDSEVSPKVSTSQEISTNIDE
jgi:glycosyltransferase involved in cell wall biosynthesis